MVLGSSPFTLAVALAGAFGFFARAPQFGSLSGVTYVRPFLSDSHGGSIPEGEPSSVHTSIVVRNYSLFSGFGSRFDDERAHVCVSVRANADYHIRAGGHVLGVR